MLGGVLYGRALSRLELARKLSAFACECGGEFNYILKIANPPAAW
jgi:hypothetical protein